MQIKVPSIVCSGCADTITKAICNLDASARIEVDLATKIVTVEGNSSSLESLKEAITATGHEVEQIGS